MGVVIGNVPFWVGFVVAFCYPLVVMILRSGVFKNVQKAYGVQKGYSVQEAYGVRYSLEVFFLCSILAGGYLTGAGFSMFNFNYPWELAIIKISVGIIGQTIPLLPDYIEKITRFDLGAKTTYFNEWRAVSFMIGLSAVIFLILQNVVMQYIQINIFGI